MTGYMQNASNIFRKRKEGKDMGSLFALRKENKNCWKYLKVFMKLELPLLIKKK